MGFTFSGDKKGFKEIEISGVSNGNRFRFLAKCNCFSVSEFKELTDRIQEECENDVVGSDNGHVPLADAILVEWINDSKRPDLWLQTSDGEPVEFTEERKAELLNEEGVAFAVYVSYQKSRYNAEAILGNSEVSRKPGSSKTRPAARNN